MTRYLEILASDRPADVGPDNSDRHQFSCNFQSTAVGPVTAFENEIAKLLTNAGLGTLNTDMFIGRKSIGLIGDGPFTTIIATSGFFSLETHNGDEYERPTCQVVVTAKTYSAARTRALAVWRQLNGQRNVTVVA